MTNISGREAAYSSHLAPMPETSGAAILRWGALIALIVETVLVIGGIVFAALHASGQ